MSKLVKEFLRGYRDGKLARQMKAIKAIPRADKSKIGFVIATKISPMPWTKEYMMSDEVSMPKYLYCMECGKRIDVEGDAGFVSWGHAYAVSGLHMECAMKWYEKLRKNNVDYKGAEIYKYIHKNSKYYDMIG